MRLMTAWLLSLAVAASMPASAEELGRLFLSPDQRNLLDARRKARVPDKPVEVVVESPITSVNGMVSRGGGKSTVWVNGQPIPEGSKPDGIRVSPRQADSGRVTVKIDESDTQVNLKIGQSFNRDSGEVHDSLGGGEVKVAPPAPKGRR